MTLLGYVMLNANKTKALFNDMKLVTLPIEPLGDYKQNL